jgi:hypothetical protein
VFLLLSILTVMCMQPYCYACSVLGIVSLCCSVYCCHRVSTQLQLTNISYHNFNVVYVLISKFDTVIVLLYRVKCS